MTRFRDAARSRGLLTATDLVVTRSGTRVLDHVSLTVSPGTRLAIVGENGRGKSTLVHALAGRLPLDAGSVERVGTLALAEQELDLGGELTVGDAIAEAIAPSRAAVGALSAAAERMAASNDSVAAAAYSEALADAESLDAWDADRRMEVALEALHANHDRDQPLAELSVGQRYRVRLACLLGGDADILLLDEPTNHLDRDGLAYLTEQLTTRRSPSVIVTHDRALLADAATHILDLDPSRDGRPSLYGNGYDGYRAGRRAEIETWEREFAHEQDERRQLRDDLTAAQNRLQTGWRPPKGTGKHQRSTRAGGLVQSVHRRQEALDAHAVSTPPPPRRFTAPQLPRAASDPVLVIDGVTVEGRVPHAVTADLAAGGRLVVAGPNGAGKSTLVSVIAGELAPTTGTVRIRAGARVAHLRQESELPLDERAATVFERHLSQLVARGVITADEMTPLSSLGLLSAAEMSQPVRHLSMGQRRRLDLALALSARPHVLLLDEPSNHLSIALVEELTEALQSTEAAVILTTHDRQLLRDTATWPRLVMPDGVIHPGAQAATPH